MSNREKIAFSKTPIFQQLRDSLAKKIAAGVYPVGSMLLNEADWARDIGVAPATLRKALDSLEADFVLERIQGRGTFVRRAEPAPPCPHCKGTGRILPAPPPTEASPEELPEEKAA